MQKSNARDLLNQALSWPLGAALMGAQGDLTEAKTVNYFGDTQMLDLS